MCRRHFEIIFKGKNMRSSLVFVPVNRDVAFIWGKICPGVPRSRLLQPDPGTPGRPGLHINATAKITVNYLQAEIPVHWDVPVHQDPINRPLIALEVTPQSASYASLFDLYNLVQK